MRRWRRRDEIGSGWNVVSELHRRTTSVDWGLGDVSIKVSSNNVDGPFLTQNHVFDIIYAKFSISDLLCSAAPANLRPISIPLSVSYS